MDLSGFISIIERYLLVSAYVLHYTWFDEVL